MRNNIIKHYHNKLLFFLKTVCNAHKKKDPPIGSGLKQIKNESSNLPAVRAHAPNLNPDLPDAHFNPNQPRPDEQIVPKTTAADGLEDTVKVRTWLWRYVDVWWVVFAGLEGRGMLHGCVTGCSDPRGGAVSQRAALCQQRRRRTELSAFHSQYNR